MGRVTSAGRAIATEPVSESTRPHKERICRQGPGKLLLMLCCAGGGCFGTKYYRPLAHAAVLAGPNKIAVASRSLPACGSHCIAVKVDLPWGNGVFAASPFLLT